MTPAVPPLPTSWNLPFQPEVGSQTSNFTAGLVTPTTRQIGSATVPTGVGFAPAGSSCAKLMVVSGSASLAMSAQLVGAATAADISSAPMTATASVVFCFIFLPYLLSYGINDVFLGSVTPRPAAIVALNRSRREILLMVPSP